MSNQGREILDEFVKEWKDKFDPPKPSGGGTGDSWLISGVWSEYLSSWIVKRDYDRCCLEYPWVSEGRRRRLDAAIWKDKKDRENDMDLVIEWEWGCSKVKNNFPKDDFLKLLTVPAKAGLAIVQLGLSDNETMAKLKDAYDKKKGNRPVGVIEIRRLRKLRNVDGFKFECNFHNLGGNSPPIPLKSLDYMR